MQKVHPHDATKKDAGKSSSRSFWSILFQTPWIHQLSKMSTEVERPKPEGPSLAGSRIRRIHGSSLGDHSLFGLGLTDYTIEFENLIEKH